MKKLFLTIMLISLVGCYEVSDGSRSGTLVKFSKKGIFCKTHEGKLLLGGTDSKGAANTWEFTVEDDQIAQVLKGKVGQIVSLEYVQEFITSPCRSDTDYFVKSIKF